MEVEVVHSGVGGNVPHPLKQAGTLVLTRDEITHNVRIVPGACRVRRTIFGVRNSCVDQALRVAPAKASHRRATAVLATTILRPMNVRRNKQRLTAVTNAVSAFEVPLVHNLKVANPWAWMSGLFGKLCSR